MPYRLFVDDSGTREYDDQRNYESSGKSRYFVYGSILLEERDASLFVSRLRELKTLVFSDPSVEVKSNWLRIPKERTKRYLQPYNISEGSLSDFVADYYRLIVQAPLRCIGVVVDKLHMQETYVAPWYAPTAAYEVLLQRVAHAVPANESVLVTVDDISGKTPKRNEYKELLRAHHERLRRYGSTLQRSISFACLKEPVRFRNSAHVDLLQVSDLVAYNVLRQFREFGTDWEKPPEGGGTLPMYEHFRTIAGKFYRSDDNRVQGYGVVKFPLKTQVKWKVVKDKDKE